jgi:hypothetical protein
VKIKAESLKIYPFRLKIEAHNVKFESNSVKIEAFRLKFIPARFPKPCRFVVSIRYQQGQKKTLQE